MRGRRGVFRRFGIAVLASSEGYGRPRVGGMLTTGVIHTNAGVATHRLLIKPVELVEVRRKIGRVLLAE